MADDATKAAELPRAIPTEVSSLEATIEGWFKDHFVGTVLGGTTELYNAAYHAKEELKSRLAAAE